MSIKSTSIFAATPTTARGQPTPLSSDPKGERIAYAANKSIFLRSIDNPSISTQYTGHTTSTTVARFSPSGFYVASGDVAGSVRVWDCVGEDKNTKGEYFIISGRINDIAWDGDSQRIIAVGDGKQRFGHCITADSGNSVGEVTGHSASLNAVSIRQQRPLRAATAGDDKSLVFYHGAPFKFNLSQRDNHSNFIYGTAFSPDGSTLVSVGGDRKIWLYDGKTGESKHTIGEGEHQGSIFGVSWAKDSRKFVTASADRTVKIWDVEAGKAIQTWNVGEGVPNQQVGVVWPSGRSDGLVISLSLSGDLNYFAEGTPETTRIVQGHQKNITSLASSGTSSGSSETLWTGSFDGRVCSWDVPSGKGTELTGDGHPNYIAGIASVDCGKEIYSVAWDDTLRNIDPSSKSFTSKSTKLPSQPKGAVAAGPDTLLVATADSIEIYSKSGSKSGSLVSPSPILSLAASSDGKLVATGSSDALVRLYSLSGSSLSHLRDIKTSGSAVTALSFSPNTSLLAIGDTTGKIRVNNTADGSVNTTRWSAHTARITSIAWNAASTHAVSGSLDTNLFVWSVASPGDRVKFGGAHKEGVNAVVWLGGGEGSKFASVGADAAVKVWEVSGLK